jgi:hypothetical protein
MNGPCRTIVPQSRTDVRLQIQFYKAVADVHGAFPVVVRPLRLGELQYQALQAIKDATEQRKGVGCKGHPHPSGCEALRSGSDSDCIFERGELGKIRLRNR